MAPLYRELDIPPVSTITAGLKARAIHKYSSPACSTWVHDLTMHQAKRPGGWYKSGKAWMAKELKNNKLGNPSSSPTCKTQCTVQMDIIVSLPKTP